MLYIGPGTAIHISPLDLVCWPPIRRCSIWVHSGSDSLVCQISNIVIPCNLNQGTHLLPATPYLQHTADIDGKSTATTTTRASCKSVLFRKYFVERKYRRRYVPPRDPSAVPED